MPDVRVLIIADDPLVRSGLAALLAGQAGIQVVSQTVATGDLTHTVEVYDAEVLLWDLGHGVFPDAALSAGIPDLPPVLGLLEDADMGQGAWTAGARGLLLREAPPERIAAALIALAEGATVFDAGVVDFLAPRGPAAPALSESLTPRELEVLRLLAEGLPNKAIAARLVLSENTVKFHVNAIFGKLGVQSRTEAVIRATRMGLVPL